MKSLIFSAESDLLVTPGTEPSSGQVSVATLVSDSGRVMTSGDIGSEIPSCAFNPDFPLAILVVLAESQKHPLPELPCCGLMETISLICMGEARGQACLIALTPV